MDVFCVTNFIGASASEMATTGTVANADEETRSRGRKCIPVGACLSGEKDLQERSEVLVLAAKCNKDKLGIAYSLGGCDRSCECTLGFPACANNSLRTNGLYTGHVMAYKLDVFTKGDVGFVSTTCLECTRIGVRLHLRPYVVTI